MKSVSKMMAERKEKRRLREISKIEPYVKETLKTSNALFILPGEFGWPAMTEEELNKLGSSLEDKGYGTIALNVATTDEDDPGEVVIFACGRNIVYAWDEYCGALKAIINSEDVNPDWREGVIEGLKRQHLGTQERYGVQLKPFEP